MDFLEEKKPKCNRILVVGSYVYLVLPLIIFVLGWIKPVYGIPFAIIIAACAVLAIKRHFKQDESLSKTGLHFWNELDASDKKRLFVIVLVVMLWVILSGISGYVWQNDDLPTRNTFFWTLIDEKWPLVRIYEDGLFAVIYYVGFWLPAAFVGKLLGFTAGNAFLTLWAAFGVLLVYGLICNARKKVEIWPLFVFIFFSGIDVIELYFSAGGIFPILGIDHLEKYSFFQYSSFTTQLFWVFNQTLPAWVATAFIVLYEKPKNIIFTWLTMLISSCFPFVGLFPFVVYVIFTRGGFERKSDFKANYWEAIKAFTASVKSVENVLGGLVAGVILFLYLEGNNALNESLKPFFAMDISLRIIGIICGVIFAILFGGAMVYLYWKKVWEWSFAVAGIIAALLAFVLLDALDTSLVNIPEFSSTKSVVYKLTCLIIFWLKEVGVYLICIYYADKRLATSNRIRAMFKILSGWLLIIPVFKIGAYNDFCMRASVPALIILCLWCIDIITREKERVCLKETGSIISQEKASKNVLAGAALTEQLPGAKKWNRAVIILVVFLVLGSVTPMHELARTYSNSKGDYSIQSIDSTYLFRGLNFGGEAKGVFWDVLAR